MYKKINLLYNGIEIKKDDRTSPIALSKGGLNVFCEVINDYNHLPKSLYIFKKIFQKLFW